MENLSINDSGLKYVELNGLPQSFFELNRTNYLQNLRKMLEGIDNNSLIILQGGKEIPNYDNDIISFHFQQEASFYYLSGVIEPDCYLVIDLKNDSLLVYIFLATDDRTRIFNHVPTLEDLNKKYGVNFKLVDDFYTDLAQRNPNKIYVLSGVNSDSHNYIHTAKFDFPDTMKDWDKRIDNDQLIYEILADTRTKKTRHEVELLKFICKSTTDGHKEMLKNIKPDMLERDAENIFNNYMRNNNYTRIWSYPSICGCGVDSATLHYGKNDNKIKDGDLMLIDCGTRIAGYCSDVTSTFPVNGKFSDRQKAIYNIVLNANRKVQENLKPGVYWPDMHKLAEEIIVTGLAELNLIKSEFSVEELITKRVPYYFMPHGLGHFVGLEVHDVGGYLSFTPPRMTEIGFNKLRTARYLNEDNVITVEPGIYFIPYLLNKAFDDPEINKYLNKEEIQKYFDFGGIRIEDDILITIDGCNNLSKDLPRTVDEIEQFMKK